MEEVAYLIEKEKIERMRHRENKKKFMLYPEDAITDNWQLFITMILLITCIIVPFRIAFFTTDDFTWQTINNSIDFMFLMDIIIIFNTAYYDEDFKIVENRKEIA